MDVNDESVLSDRCFRDFFPFNNKKYKNYYDDLNNIIQYDWQSYQNLLEVGADRKEKTYCKRKCYNQRFSPGKYNNTSDLYPTIEDLIEYVKIMDADPSNSKENCIWTIQNRETISKLNVEDVQRNIEIFFENYPQKVLPPNYEELIFDIKNTIFDPNREEIEIQKYTKGTSEAEDMYHLKILYDGKYGRLLIPLDKKTSCKFGKGTKWCTAAEIYDNEFDYYFRMDPIYVWIERPGKYKYQFHWGEFEFKDAENEDITRQEFKEFRDHPIISKLFETKEEELIQKFYDLNKDFLKNPQKREKLNKYIFYWLNGNWPELQTIIESDQKIAKYLFDIFMSYTEYKLDDYDPKKIRLVKYKADPDIIILFKNMETLMKNVKFAGVSQKQINELQGQIYYLLYLMEERNITQYDINLKDQNVVYTFIDKYGFHTYEYPISEMEDRDIIQEKIKTISMDKLRKDDEYNTRRVITYRWKDAFGKHIYEHKYA